MPLEKRNFAFYITDIGMASVAKEAGSVVQRTVPRTLIPTADSQLQLGGSLIAYASRNQLEFTNVPEMTGVEWMEVPE